MNTPTHVIVAAACLAKPGETKRNLIIFFGAILPDLSIYLMSAWALSTGNFNSELWSVTYWQEPWQTLGAISNSVPLAVLLLAIGLWRDWPLLNVFALALLLHALLDLPVHANDAHRHFWPLTDWRFISPVSYWDPRHNGWLGTVLDTSLLILASVLLWQRFEARWVRWTLVAFTAVGLSIAAASLWFAAGFGNAA